MNSRPCQLNFNMFENDRLYTGESTKKSNDNWIWNAIYPFNGLVWFRIIIIAYAGYPHPVHTEMIQPNNKIFEFSKTQKQPQFYELNRIIFFFSRNTNQILWFCWLSELTGLIVWNFEWKSVEVESWLL